MCMCGACMWVVCVFMCVACVYVCVMYAWCEYSVCVYACVGARLCVPVYV